MGKVEPGVLRGLVLKNLGAKRSEVVLPAGFGEDASVLDFGGQPIVASTDPITAAGSEAGRLAVIISCNDVAAGGAEPVGILLTVMLPEEGSAEDLERIMRQADEAAKEMNVQIVGGHTEVIPHVDKPILCCTALGKAFADTQHWPITSGSCTAGDEIILTKTAALEGTAILAADLNSILRERGVSEEELERAQALGDSLSVVREAEIAAGAGARAMHDVTEGGVLGAVFEVASAARKGAVIEEEKIPLAPCTEKICRVLELNPLRLISSGALLVTASREARVADVLREEGVQAEVIGKITDEPAVSLIRGLADEGSIREPISPPETDEIWKAYSRFGPDE